MQWWYGPTLSSAKPPLPTRLDAYQMLKRILKDGVLEDGGLQFKDCATFRHWHNEIYLEGLAIIPDVKYVREMRVKFLPLSKVVVHEVRKLIAELDHNLGVD